MVLIFAFTITKFFFENIKNIKTFLDCVPPLLRKYLKQSLLPNVLFSKYKPGEGPERGQVPGGEEKVEEGEG